MNILHVFCSNIFSGAVAYALSLAEHQLSNHHKVHIITDDKNLPAAIPVMACSISDRSFKQRIRNVLFVRNYIKKHDIQVVHCHSRASSWVVNFAAAGLPVAVVSTIHGRQHIHLSSKNSNIYGKNIIAVAENIAIHLKNELGISPDYINTIPNIVQFDKISSFNQPSATKDILLVTRFSGKKGEIAIHILSKIAPPLLEKNPAIRFIALGGGLENQPLQVRQALESLQKRFDGRLLLPGHVHNVSSYMANAHLVIGAGRVAIDAIGMQKPLLAIGEACCHGLIDTQNLQEAIASNFGDILPTLHKPELNWQLLQTDLERFLSPNQQHTSAAISDYVRHFYDREQVYRAIHKVYEKAIARKLWPQPIPILMYHKIPDRPIDSPNKIFVTKSTFHQHLRLIKLRGLQPITFRDYLAYAKGEKHARTAPKRPVILTFDDGYKDNYDNLLPLMNEYGYKGVIFMLGDTRVSYNYWDADQGDHRDELMNEHQRAAFIKAGWEIGAHTMTHPNLTQITAQKAFEEIVNSKKALEKETGSAVQVFAYTFGAYNQEIKQFAQEAGFEMALATDRGGMHIEDDRFEIFRINIFPQDGYMQMIKKTSSWYRRYYKWKRNI